MKKCKLEKSFSLDDLKKQVDAAVEELDAFRRKTGILLCADLPDTFSLGDFEIRSKK
jgi:hypothetical protein